MNYIIVMTKHPLEIDGIHYPSKIAAIRAHGIAPSVFIDRIRRGYTIKEALGIEKKEKLHSSWSKEGFRNKEGLIESSILIQGCYKLYEIVNLVDGKRYIGITIQSLKHRFQQHVSLAKTMINHPLYNAMRKYGIDNFEIRLIRNDAANGVELLEQECQEISNRDATKNGYNVHAGGYDGNRKSIRVGVLIFNSRAEAAQHFGINPSVFGMRIGRLNWTPEQAAEIEPPPNVRKHYVELDGERIRLREAARRLGKQYKNVFYRVQNGWTYEQALELVPPPTDKRLHMELEVEGKIFPSLKAAARFYGVEPSTAHARIRYQGYTVREALGIDVPSKKVMMGKGVTAFGESYPSIAACAKAQNLSAGALYSQMDKYGKDAETAITYLKNRDQGKVPR